MPHVLIVGGGIAGLAAAYELRKRSIPFTLFEAGPRLGGVILSEQVDGYVIDGGPDSLIVQKPEGIALCRELGLGDRLIPTSPPRLSYILRRGTLYALPAASVLGIPTRVGPFVRTNLFSWPGKLRMGSEVFSRPRHETDDESIGAFMRRHFGREATEYLAEPLLAGIHAGDVDRLSIGSLFPRFVEAERRHGSLLRAFRSQALRQSPSPDGVFRSLPGGLSELVAALAAVLSSSSIRLRTPIDRVTMARSDQPVTDRDTLQDAHSRPVVTLTTSTGERVDGTALILAAPSYAAAHMLRDVDADLAALCGETVYVSTGTVAMAFKREAIAHPLNGSGFVVPRVERTDILAGSWLSSKWAHRAPEGRVLLRTFVGGARDPGALERTDAELASQSLAAIRPLLGIAGEPLLTRVYRWERANAQHEVGHHARMQRIEQALARHPGLYLTGSGFRSVGIPDCIADGRSTAARVAAYLS
ncbi:MAG TPA: protoporphyrinogen oxidase [Vicinamibacterales bacterium]|nr:protoporphyrinogen oxidase [Vicinamibacterales bacterium]